MGHQTQVKQCDKCKGTIITTRIFNKEIKSTNCKCMETQIGIDKRSYINPKEMDFISYVLNSKDEFDTTQREWYISKILTRLQILQPLVNECINKGLSFDIVSSDLNNEYNDLIFMRNKHCMNK